MKTYNMIGLRGFSFVEVLVCLMIISGTSLVLFKQQMQLSHSVRKIKSDMAALLVLDNAREQ
ncbi:MAG: type II secretion system protein [Legionella sp.]|nr:type II secretion system protein [Legionella sp.]